MKLYILRWNPNISMEYEQFRDWFEQIKDENVESRWSVHEHEELEEGDIFLFNVVGYGKEDGIAGLGTFISDPYADENWYKKDGTNVFYADLRMDCLIERTKTDLLCAEKMENLFPEIDWHGGHSGILVENKLAEKLITYIIQKLVPYQFPSEQVSFCNKYGEVDLAMVFASYINGCCPDFIKAVIEKNSYILENYKTEEVIDESLVEISDQKFGKNKLENPCSYQDLLDFFIAVV